MKKKCAAITNAALVLALSASSTARAQDAVPAQNPPTSDTAAAEVPVTDSAPSPPDATAPPALEPTATPAPTPPLSSSTPLSLADVRIASAQSAPEFTLEEVLALALQNNPQRAAALAAARAAEARIGTARSAGGVQVGLSGNAGLDRSFGNSAQFTNGSGGVGGGPGGGGPGGGGPGGGGPGGGVGSGSNGSSGDRFLGFNSAQSLGVDATLPVYNGGRVRASTRAAQAGANAQNAQAQQTEQDLLLNTTTAYLDVLRTNQLLQVEDSNVAVSRERRRISGVRFEAGAAARLEVFQAEADLANAEQRRITAANTLGQATAGLNTLIGRVPEAPLRISSITSLDLRVPLPDPNSSVAALREVAAAARPTLEVARSQVQNSEANVELARAQRRPNLGLSLGGLLRNPVTFAGRFALSIGLGLSQTLFDSGRTRSQITEAQALLEQSRLGLAGQQLVVANQIENALLGLNSAQARTGNADTAVTAAQEALRAAQLGFQAGARTALEVSDAQAALLTAQTNAVNARFDVATSQAQLAAAVGVLTGQGQTAAQQTAQSEAAATRQVVAPVKKKRKKFLGIF
jgi:outer membrane protein TolC